MPSSLILAIDNSQEFLNLGLSEDSRLIEERHVRSVRHPSEIIASQVSSILGDHGYEITSVAKIITTLGPGSFTGIRVALSFCKGMQAGLGIPLCGVPTLDVLAAPFNFLEGHYLLPLVDARKGEVFTALYVVSRGKPERLSEFRALKPADAVLLAQIPCVAFGTGVSVCRPLFEAIEGVTIIEQGFTRVSAEVLIWEGLKKDAGCGDEGLKPIYGRLSEAEIKFKLSLL